MNRQVIISVVMLVGLICFAVFLRRQGVLKEDQGPIFGNLVTKVTLPALIFVTLVKTHVLFSETVLALVMVAAELVSLGLAWLAARALKLSRPQTGAMLLTAGFGSSSLLGYPLISHLFANNASAVTEAVVISELGVGPLLFTLGTFIAIYYGSPQGSPQGSAQGSAQKHLHTVLRFFYSPIFISVVLGLLASALGLPWQSPEIKPLIDALDFLAQANTFAVVLTVGLLLNFGGLTSIISLALLVGGVKLILKPILVWLPVLGLDLASWQMQVLVLEAAMPSAMLSVPLSASYGCDAKLASKLVFATSVACSVTIMVMFSLLT
ncbi:MAG: AEC family transporter [Deltaproteobacteria bacterium]|nr:AEC family transporter [Deltaproteobacteria bacterium]